MSDGAENVATVRAALDAFQRQDMQAFLPFLDLEIETFSAPELANPIHVVGRDKWLAWVADWYDAWETFEIEAEAIEPVGARHVIVTALQRGTGKGSGIEVELRVYYMFELQNGVATRYHLYPEREPALEAARAGQDGESSSDIVEGPPAS
jgi:ketosteroid isomerase-like protein